MPLMDIAGRRPLLLWPMAAMIIDLVIMTVCRVLQVNKFHDSSIDYYSLKISSLINKFFHSSKIPSFVDIFLSHSSTVFLIYQYINFKQWC